VDLYRVVFSTTVNGVTVISISIFGGFFEFIEQEKALLMDIFWAIVALMIVFAVFIIVYKPVKRTLVKKAKTKRQLSNVLMFLKIIKYTFVFIVVVATISIWFGSWAQLPLIVGFLSVAVGLALQKPIVSILAWAVMVTRRPFTIGDRIIVDGIKGDVKDITLTHTYLDEVGGTIDGEESSGREIVIPNSFLFEKDIVNYTARDEYILDEIKTSITYESNLKKAEQLILRATSKVMEPLWETFPKRISREPHIRLRFQDSGVEVVVRYFTLATKRNEIATAITREIFSRVRNAKDVEFAYPHTEVLLREK